MVQNGMSQYGDRKACEYRQRDESRVQYVLYTPFSFRTIILMFRSNKLVTKLIIKFLCVILLNLVSSNYIWHGLFVCQFFCTSVEINTNNYVQVFYKFSMWAFSMQKE